MKPFAIIAALTVMAGTGVRDVSTDEGRGLEILLRFIETNRYWLVGPPPAVRQFCYTLQRKGGPQEFAVTDPAKSPRARRQGVTYSTMLHQLASKPESATVGGLTEEGGRIRLTLSFDPPVRGACGNGVENSWNGYFNLGGDAGYLVLDAARLIPLEAGMGSLTETFGEFVAVDSTHFVPLAITIQKEEIRFDWRFRLYEPGLWIFDDSHYGGQRITWVEEGSINQASPVLRRAAAESLARERAEVAGTPALREFLNTNQHWLWPSLSARRGLIYEYRQEAPYLERVLFDPEGNVFARLEASKESPEKPTRQQFWLADGRKVVAGLDDPYVKIEAAPVPQDRMLQHFAMGLALECALTRLVREPDAFWAETLPAAEPGQYRLVLHPRKDVRLFAGTMLGFTSWAYMHDVTYNRSEIVCAAATHRPLAERDYDGKDELKGEFHFDEWLTADGGSAPGSIRAVIPHQKNGKDQSLEMEARFQYAPPGVWLLHRVESRFRGDGGGSTGTVSVVSAQAGSVAPITEMLARVTTTGETLAAIQAAPVGTIEVPYPSRDWTPCALNATWTETARSLAGARQTASPPGVLIGIYRARLESASDGPVQVCFEGVSTASWQEVETEWKVRWHTAAGQSLGTATTNVTVRSEQSPSAFAVTFTVPPYRRENMPARMYVEGTVRRMTGAYHGHGMWMRFTRDSS